MNASKILNFVLLIVIILMLVWNGVNTRNNKTEVAASAVENTDTVRHSSGEFVKIDINNLNESAVKLFAKDWFVLTAGDGETFNPMTISWGGLGELWNEPVVTVYVRHNRYTYQYMTSYPF